LSVSYQENSHAPSVWTGGPAGSRRHVYAALDLGSNNCRLLIARPARAGFRVIDAFSRIVRLGEGVGREGRLSEAAVGRTIEALKICADKMRRRGVTHARHVATEACRRATNGASFLELVSRETGIALEIISPSEEARLAVIGCAPLLEAPWSQALLFDIGGGSTELIWLRVGRGGTPRMVDMLSLPYGVVNLAERYGGRQVDAATYQAMVAEMQAALAAFDAKHDIAGAVAGGAVRMLGTSGTVTTLAGVHLGLARYDRALIDGCYLSFEVLEAVSRQLCGMSYEQRAAHPCVGPERADLVIAGVAILEAICRIWPVGRLRVADRGVREGILIGLAQHGRRPAARRPRVSSPRNEKD
jgi:exopolyphosphatase / guanosine-5'-triphosphate,3'-diphosphate pyrophosphatase